MDVMFRLVVLLMAVVAVGGSADRWRLHDDPNYVGDGVGTTAPQAAPNGWQAASDESAGSTSAAPSDGSEAAVPTGSTDGQNQQGSTHGDEGVSEPKAERTDWGPNIGTGEKGEFLKSGTGITVARPGQVGPIPGCYINDSGYMCCNNELEEILLKAHDELRKLDPTKSDCNTLRQAKYIQERSQKFFGTNFETIVALDDFAFRTNFLGNMTCKVEVNGRYMLAYATPDVTKVDKYPIYQSTPNPYFPPPPPLRPDYGQPPPPAPANYGPPPPSPSTNYAQPPPPPQPSQPYNQQQRSRWSA